jgi:DNA-binding transcriptional ArsR family regulator
MNDVPSIASVGALIGQAARADMLLLLLDGRGRTATELADAANVTRSTASSHLSQLVNGGLVRVDRQGRHRYYRLASPQIADILKSLLVITNRPNAPEPRFGPRPTAMRHARMCYDHMAGTLGIGVVDSLTRSGALVENGDDFELTSTGEQFLTDFGVDVTAARRRRRHFARTCIDWSERRPHLAGALGAAIADRFFELNWIHRELAGRTLHITPAGHEGLADVFSVEMPLN